MIDTEKNTPHTQSNISRTHTSKRKSDYYMVYNIDKEKKEPAYMQLYKQIRADIVNGVYKCGTKLPSKRLVAAETGVSVITVEHTYDLLCDEGYAEAHQRSGYFVIYNVGECFPVSESTDNAPKRTFHNVDTEFPFSVYGKTVRKVLSEYDDAVLVKSPNNGCRELRCAIATYLARSRGIKVEPHRIIIGSGAEYLYSIIIQTLGRDRGVAIEDPSYEKIRKVYIANGVNCEPLKMGTDGIKTTELENAKSGILHVTPFNSFPSGVTASASKRSEYVRWARERNGYIIEDDFDSEFTVSMKAADTLFSLDGERTIYMNTFSKTIAPSVRVGYAVLPEELMPLYEKKVGFYSCTVPVLEQYVLAELIENGDFERHINRVRRKRRNESPKSTKQK